MAYEWINKKTNQPLNKTKSVDGVVVDLTAEEISAIETKRETAINQYNIDKEAKEKAKTDKASAKAKLIAGEALTEDEANTIVL